MPIPASLPNLELLNRISVTGDVTLREAQIIKATILAYFVGVRAPLQRIHIGEMNVDDFDKMQERVAYCIKQTIAFANAAFPDLSIAIDVD